MTIIKKLALTIILLGHALSAIAQNPPLRVATPQFVAPFVMKGMHQLYGFDISMINDVCTIINRECKFQIMPFDKLLQSVANNNSDVAIGAITITTERSKIVNFSTPYMIPDTRFLGKANLANTPVDLKLLGNSTIGIIKGTIFADEIKKLGVINPRINTYANQGDLISALNSGSIDLALVDNGTAMYWQSQSDQTLVALGKPISYGFGIGIAVNPKDTALLEAINQALTQYQNSPEFTRNYNEYLKYF